MKRTGYLRLWLVPLFTFLPFQVTCSQQSSDGTPNGSPDGNSSMPDPKLERDCPLTVFPVRLAGKSHVQVGQVLAILLEQRGMTRVETNPNEFRPPEGIDLKELTTGFGEFIRGENPGTEFSMFVDVLGTPQAGASAIRVCIVDRRGELVWQDELNDQDPAFRDKRPRDPMQCCMLVVETLRRPLGLRSPKVGSAEGRHARQWAAASNVPNAEELRAVSQHQQKFKALRATVGLAIFPILAGETFSDVHAQELVKSLQVAGWKGARGLDKGPQPRISPDINEQRILWDAARQVREFVRTNPPDADYVLFAHYLLEPTDRSGAKVHAVHVIVCDRKGQWVFVDFQNDHHVDFQDIAPSSVVDCHELVVRRLKP